MSPARLFTYATWAAFAVTGTLFLAGLASNNGGGDTRHIAADIPGLRIHPNSRTGPGYHPPDPRNVPIHIDVYEFGFAPSNTIVKVGQAIAFRGVGKQIHNIIQTSPAGEQVFRDAQQYGTARPVFTKPGVYPYACVIHPQMKGTVTVVSHF